MTINEVKVNCHGSLEHFVSIAIATRICVKRNYKQLDIEWFKKKALYPGEPDLYVITPKGDKWVIEVELNPTAESIAKKEKQFIAWSNENENKKTTDLIICDMRKADLNSISSISSYLTGRIP